MASEITMVKIRATIRIGNNILAETPFILSFNVNKARGQISTFDASVKVLAGTSNLTGGQVQIEAGEEGHENKIFSGVVKKATISPCFDDPQYVIINLSGRDVLGQLEGKKFTRRCKASRTAWISIDGVTRKGLKSGKFKYKVEDILITQDTELDEGTGVRKTLGTANLGPWDKIKEATEDRSPRTITPEITYVTEEGSF